MQDFKLTQKAITLLTTFLVSALLLLFIYNLALHSPTTTIIPTAGEGEACTPHPLRIALAFDKSDSMKFLRADPPQPLTDAKTAAVSFVNSLNYSRDRLAFITYAERAQIEVPLSADRTRLVSSINGVTTSPGTNISEAISLSASHLGSVPDSDGKKIIILFSDGRATRPGTLENALLQVVVEADAAKQRGIRIITIGLGQAADQDTLRRAASTASDYFFAPTANDMVRIYQDILASIGGTDPIPPQSPTLISPPDNSTTPSNDVIINWENTGSWGNGCPTNPSNDVQIQLNCTGEWVSRGDTRLLNNLNWGVNYCWRVVRSNGPTEAVSPVWRFTTPAGPKLDAAYFNVESISKCPAPMSGRASQPSTNNPITIVTEVSDIRNNFSEGTNVIQNVRLALIPEQQPLLFFYNTDRRLHNTSTKSAIGVRVTNLLETSPAFSSVNNTNGAFSGSVTSGNHTVASGIATLLDINGTQTKVERIDNQKLRITWTLRIEESYSNIQDLGVYVAVVSRAVDGNLVTQVSQPSHTGGDGNLAYERVLQWGVDNEPPSAGITSPRFISADRFTADWNASDNIGLRTLSSYCAHPGGDLAVLDERSGRVIVLQQQLGNYPAPDHCGVYRTAELGNRNYKLQGQQASEESEGLEFRLLAEDLACNRTSVTAELNLPRPWIITLGGNTSANGGFIGIVIPSIASEILSGIVERATQGSYLSSFLSMSGNLQLPATRQSAMSIYTTNYTNLQVSPPDIGGESNWYDYIASVLRERGGLQSSAAGQVGGSLRNAYSHSASQILTVVHSGNLTVNGGTVCDLQAVILVQGNLTINPDLNIQQGEACMFVVKGNVVVNAGGYKSTGIPSDGTAKYDLISAMIIADGKFSTSPDRPGELGDGLMVDGGLLAGSVELKRDIGLGANTKQPAEVFKLDPYYWSVFGDLLSLRTFSLRTNR